MAIEWQILPDAPAVAERAAALIGQSAREAIAQRGRFSLVLAGGGTPEATYRLLAGTAQQWQDWDIWFGDERCLPPDHPQRNSRMAMQAWLSQVAIPASRVHPIPAELGPQAGAARYADELSGQQPFDLVLLGVGEDGHTASLFPGNPLGNEDLTLAVENAPKPPPARVSLSLPALSRCRRMLILVTGQGKRKAVTNWRAGDTLPIGAVSAAAPSVEVLLDRVAAGADPDRFFNRA